MVTKDQYEQAKATANAYESHNLQEFRHELRALLERYSNIPGSSQEANTHLRHIFGGVIRDEMRQEQHQEAVEGLRKHFSKAAF